MRTAIPLFLTIALPGLVFAQATPQPEPSTIERQTLERWLGDWTFETTTHDSPLGASGTNVGAYSVQPRLAGPSGESRSKDTGPGESRRRIESDGFDPARGGFFWSSFAGDAAVIDPAYAFDVPRVAMVGTLLAGDKHYRLRSSVTFADDLQSLTDRREISADGVHWTLLGKSRAAKIRPVLAAPLVAADRFAAIPARLQDFVDRGEIAGAVTLIADKARILHLGAVGSRDLASGVPMQTDDLFAIASMTKPFTAVAVALLVDEGRLTFDDPVEKHLPEFRDLWTIVEETTEPRRRVLAPSPRPVTVRDLLAHTSGLGPVEPRDPHWTMAEVARLLARTPLRFAPGSRWDYCDSGYFVLGRIVEVVAGEPFPAYVQLRILAPLGMEDTTFCLSPAQRARLALCYRRDPAGGKLVPARPPASFGDPNDATRGPNPAGGLFSTAADLAIFHQMLLKGGEHAGRRFLRAETVAELVRPQTGTLSVLPGISWGLGFAILADPAKLESTRAYSPGSFGHGGATGTVVWTDPGRGTIHGLLLQRMGLPNVADSPMRIAFEQAADTALHPPP